MESFVIVFSHLERGWRRGGGAAADCNHFYILMNADVTHSVYQCLILRGAGFLGISFSSRFTCNCKYDYHCLNKVKSEFQHQEREKSDKTTDETPQN